MKLTERYTKLVTQVLSSGNRGTVEWEIGVKDPKKQPEIPDLAGTVREHLNLTRGEGDIYLESITLDTPKEGVSLNLSRLLGLQVHRSRPVGFKLKVGLEKLASPESPLEYLIIPKDIIFEDDLRARLSGATVYFGSILTAEVSLASKSIHGPTKLKYLAEEMGYTYSDSGTADEVMFRAEAPI